MISQLPVGSDYNSSIVKNPYIYVTGYHIGVYTFKVDTDEYTSSFDLFVNGKILILESGNLFILSSKGVYIFQGERWVRVKKNSVLREEAVLISYPVKKGNYVYFLMIDNYLLKFNLNTFEIERVKMLEYN